MSTPEAQGIRPLQFGSDLTFQLELNRRIDDYFATSGRPRRGCWQVYLKTLLILICFAIVYGLLIFATSSIWQGLLLVILLALLTAGIGFNVQHEGGHQAYSERRWINRIMAFSMDLIGSSSYRWHWKHAVIHHRYVNVVGYDGDMNLEPFGRLSPHEPRRWFHRYQHVYLWGIYSLLSLKMQFADDLRFLVIGRLENHRVPRPTGGALLALLIGRGVFLTWALVIPLLFHPLWVVLFFYLAGSLVLGLTLSLVFIVPHLVAEAGFPLPAENGSIATPWAIHQAMVTVNFAPGNRLVTWLVGGLNYHKEHHLFPLISHANYAGMSPIVEATCRDFGLPYKRYPSFAAGLAAHYRWLKRMGSAD